MPERYVGILVNDALFAGIPKGRTGHEHIPFYEEAGKEYGVIPAYFRLRDISLRSNQIKALICNKGTYRLHTIPLPKVIHNRAMYLTNPQANRLLEKLCANNGCIVFNHWNRYGKMDVHNWLMEKRELRPHLPETKLASAEAIHKLSGRHEAVIIKPDNSSIGRGIMKLDRSDGKWRLTYPEGSYHKRSVWRTMHYKHKLPGFLLRRIQERPFVAQQRLNLATYGGRPFDMRVSVQRSAGGLWQMTGIAVKVARKNAFVTNVAQGGTVYRLTDVLTDHPQLNPSAVALAIQRFALQAAEHMGSLLPNLADIGFDIGITPEGFPVFIEMNLRDLRYSFKEGGMMEEWKRTYANPMVYARYLLDGIASE